MSFIDNAKNCVDKIKAGKAKRKYAKKCNNIFEAYVKTLRKGENNPKKTK